MAQSHVHIVPSTIVHLVLVLQIPPGGSTGKVDTRHAARECRGVPAPLKWSSSNL